MKPAEPLRAPRGAHGWSPATGWLYSADELAARVDGDAYVLTVSSDGRLRGVQPHDRAPLSAVVRLDGDLVEVVERLDDLADTVAGIDTAEATDVNMMRARVDASVRPVDQLEGCAP